MFKQYNVPYARLVVKLGGCPASFHSELRNESLKLATMGLSIIPIGAMHLSEQGNFLEEKVQPTGLKLFPRFTHVILRHQCMPQAR